MSTKQESRLRLLRVSLTSSYNLLLIQNTGLCEMIVGVLTTATSIFRCNPMWFLSMGLRQGSGLCSSCSRKYSGTQGMNQNSHWNHHRWHATNSLERTRLSCWYLSNHKGCTYRAPVRYVTKTWSVIPLNKKNTYTVISSLLCMTSC